MVRTVFTCVSLSLLSVGEAAGLPALVSKAVSPVHAFGAPTLAEAVLPTSHLVTAHRKSTKHKVAAKGRTRLQQMTEEIRSLRGELVAQHKACEGPKQCEDLKAGGTWDEDFEAMEKQLEELEQMLCALEDKEADHPKGGNVDHKALQAEIDHLREQVRRLEGKDGDRTLADCDKDETTPAPQASDRGTTTQQQVGKGPADAVWPRGHDVWQTSEEEGVETQGGSDVRGDSEEHHGKHRHGEHKQAAHLDVEEGSEEVETAEQSHAEHLEGDRAAPCDEVAPAAAGKGPDIDMQMPYGDLEPFGREDTAQELTEASIKESNQMVDQLERSEVAEEKRAVFRALTRLRGAAITSYDGIARSQTGNIDDYARTNQWRKVHPVHHLASEEADVQKWAFPDDDQDAGAAERVASPGACVPMPECL